MAAAVRLGKTKTADHAQEAACYGGLSIYLPITRPLLHNRHAVIVVNCTVGARVAPIPFAILAIFGSAAELVLGDAGDVAAKTGVILQRLPRQRVMIIAEAKEAAKSEHGVRNSAALLVDHDSFD